MKMPVTLRDHIQAPMFQYLDQLGDGGYRKKYEMQLYTMRLPLRAMGWIVLQDALSPHDLEKVMHLCYREYRLDWKSVDAALYFLMRRYQSL